MTPWLPTLTQTRPNLQRGRQREKPRTLWSVVFICHSGLSGAGGSHRYFLQKPEEQGHRPRNHGNDLGTPTKHACIHGLGCRAAQACPRLPMPIHVHGNERSLCDRRANLRGRVIWSIPAPYRPPPHAMGSRNGPEKDAHSPGICVALELLFDIPEEVVLRQEEWGTQSQELPALRGAQTAWGGGQFRSTTGLHSPEPPSPQCSLNFCGCQAGQPSQASSRAEITRPDQHSRTEAARFLPPSPLLPPSCVLGSPRQGLPAAALPRHCSPARGSTSEVGGSWSAS